MTVLSISPDTSPQEPSSIIGDFTPSPDTPPNPQLHCLTTPPSSPADTGNTTFSDLRPKFKQLLKCCLQKDFVVHNRVCRLDSSSNYRLFVYLSTAEATPQSSWTSRLGNLLGHGVTLIKGLFNPTSDHPTVPPEMPATTQPVTATTVSQHPEHTGIALVIVWYYYNERVIVLWSAVLKS